MKALTCSCTLGLLLTAGLAAAQYQATVLSQTGFGSTVSGGTVGGYSGSGVSARATLWDFAGNPTDLHPQALLGANSRSTINDQSGLISVGGGASNSTLGRSRAIKWDGATASFLAAPFDVYMSNAIATDGVQIVGTAYPYDTFRDAITAGDSHAIVWDAATGSVIVDLYRGKPIVVNGVGGGKQVGYELRNSTEARMWNGDPRTPINLHPAAFHASVANDTDGATQVGYVGLDRQVYGEKRGRRVRFNYASVWTGTQASFQTLDMGTFSDTYAVRISHGVIAGSGEFSTFNGIAQHTHAVVWSGAFRTLSDLHQFVPEEFTDSRAIDIDAQGNIAGYAWNNKGRIVPVVWTPQG